MRLKQQDILDYLEKHPGSSETEIQRGAWGYRRGYSWESNNRYSRILRRALDSGKIKRLKVKVKIGPDKSVYRYCLATQSFDVIFKQIEK
jgi:hypothetical protein